MAKNIFLRKLATVLRKARMDKGMSQEALADESNVARSTIARIESAKLDPSATTLNKISQGLGIPLKILLDF